MENESNLQVTFSKRRVGLFKKASELCTLTGSEAAVVVFSPGNKAHSFGHPDVHTVANKLLAPNSLGDVANQSNHVFQREVERQIEAERAKGEEIERMRKACEKEKWFPSTEGLSYQQLEHLKGAVMDFGKKLETQYNTVIPYDQGATRAGEEDMSQGFNAGYGPGHF
ncbi:UNVERIFIED_CONTAM: Agamous-like MADS-box protein [Sesamum latifolium]|uniref:Agamous-like MADS-box protein n=1 Tax=Sesamum latifolium TaxID=2727402 RepID=A0AAW2UYR9_9LAMI